MSDEAAFLEALKSNPADDTARLVYADWLDEHDQPQKAEYLRAVVELVGANELNENALAVRTATRAAAIPRDWRLAAAARFGLVYEGHDRDKKISAIKFVREITGSGLGEAKRFVESAPQELLFRTTLECALGVGWHSKGYQFRVRPRADVTAVPTFISYQVIANRADWVDEYEDRSDSPSAESVSAFASFLSAALGWEPERVAAVAQDEAVSLGHDLEHPEVGELFARWSALLPPDDPSQNWTIAIYALRCEPTTQPLTQLSHVHLRESPLPFLSRVHARGA